MSEYSATIKLKADRSGLTGELKIATADIAKLNEELQRSGAAGAAGADGVKQHGEETRRAADGTKRLGSETKSLRDQFLSLKSILATLGIITLGREMVSTLAQFQDTRTMIQGLTSDSREYAETQNYLIGVADRYSGNLNTISESYARLLSLKKADILTTGESRDLLEGLLDAGAQLKASNEQLGLVYYGLAQALSQAKVQAQELNQIVEPLPGILNHMDTAAGLSAGSFRRMVMEGEVTSKFFKETLIVALEAYNGAAAKTYDNISAISRRVSNQHTLLVAQLETPIDASIGALLATYEAGLKSLNTNLPDLIELMKDLIDITLVMMSAKVAVWLYGIAAASVAAHGAFTLLELRMMATMAVARLMPAVLAGLRGALTLVGGPAGIALLAATAVFAFGSRSDEAALRTARLRDEVNFLASAFEELTVSQIDQQIADQMSEMGRLGAEKLALAAPKLDLNAVVSTAYAHQLQQYKSAVESLDSELESGVATLNALAASRAGAVARALLEESSATAALSALQQELLDKYLPLEKLTREYQANLSALSAIEATSTEEAQRKASAIAVLTAVYEEEIKEITGATAAEEAALKVREQTLQQMAQLIDQYAPMQNAQAIYTSQLTLLTQARDEDLISLANYHIAIAALAQEQHDALNPGAVLIKTLKEELAVLKMGADEMQFHNLTRGMSVDQIIEHEGAIRDLIVALREEQAGLDASEQSMQSYQQSTQTMLDDLQRSWGDHFEQLLRSGKLSFESLKDTILDIWASTIARMQSQSMSNAFQSAFTAGSGSPGAVAGNGQSGSVNWAQLASVVGGGVSSVLSSSMISSSAPIYEGGQLISEGAKSLNLSLSNLGTNLLAGYAGGKLGTMAGEAVFGKTAESNIGATAGAIIGSFIPVIGTFLGGMIGGALDAAFGGDGMKRSSVGFDTGRDSVRDSYYAGTETFASGLTINKVNRRGDDAAMDAIVAKGAEIDAFITSAARGAGATLSMSGRRLKGVSGDYGNDDGSFVGMRMGDGQDSQAALDSMFASFSTQLIGHIEGLSADVTQAMLSATGTADEILQQFHDTLALDKLVKTGALDVLGDLDFGFAQQLVEAAGGLENLSAATTVFNNSVADSATAQQNIVERLRTAVSEQFAALNLSLSDYSSVEQFREQFDLMKGSLDAADLYKLVQAGNALNLLIDQEEQLSTVRAEAMSEQLDSAQSLIDAFKALRAQATNLSGTIANDIYKLSGSSITDLRSRMRTGTYDEQLDVIDQMRAMILDNYASEMDAKQELHREAMKHYEAQHDAAKRIDEYMKDVLVGSLSPLSIADRLTTAQSNFDAIYAKAMGGDLEAARGATGAFDALAKVNQQANASSVTGVDIFNDNYAKLGEISARIGGAQAPAALNAASVAQPYVAQLTELQNEVTRIQSGMGAEVLADIVNLQLLLTQLPMKIAQELVKSLPTALRDSLQIATNLGLLKTDVRDALGLLPQAVDLSAGGIAAAIEAITLLSQHPALLAGSIGTLLSALPGQIGSSLQLAANLGVLAESVRTSLGLLPQAIDLSSSGIASSIEALTLLSQHPTLFATNLQGLANLMGSMMSSLVAAGTPHELIADTISANPTAAAAANQYLSQQGLGSLADYQSPRNPDVSAQAIVDYIESVKATAVSEEQVVDTVMQAARDNGVGSLQLAQALGASQSDVLALAAAHGWNSTVASQSPAAATLAQQTANVTPQTVSSTYASANSGAPLNNTPAQIIQSVSSSVLQTPIYNPAVSPQAIADFVASVKATALSEQQVVDTVVQAALDMGVGSAQLAQGLGGSQDDVLALAAKYGWPSFAIGTDRVEKDGPAYIHQEEIIFDRPRSSKIRDAVVNQMTGSGSADTQAKLLRAIERQSALLEALVAQMDTMSAQQQAEFRTSSREISEGIARLTREIEELAA